MAINLTVASSAPVGLSVGADTGVTLTASAGAGAGTTNYEALNNKPSIEGVELTGNKTLSELNAYTKGQTDTLMAQKADRNEIPSLEGYATQQWVQDKHYLTQHQSLSEYYTKGQTNSLLNGKANASDIPTKVSDLANDSGSKSCDLIIDPARHIRYSVPQSRYQVLADIPDFIKPITECMNDRRNNLRNN